MVDELVFVIIIACLPLQMGVLDHNNNYRWIGVCSRKVQEQDGICGWWACEDRVPITGHHIIGLRKSSLIIILGQQQCTYLPLP